MVSGFVRSCGIGGMRWVVMGILLWLSVSAGGVEVVWSGFCPDREFPHLLPWIIDGWDLKYGMGEPRPYREIVPAGATLRVVLRNNSQGALNIKGVWLNEIDLTKHLLPVHQEHRGIGATSYRLNDAETTPQEIKERLDRLGAPIYYQVRPQPIPVGGFSELLIRLRCPPKEEELKVAVMGEQGTSVTTTLSLAQPAGLCFRAINFNRDISAAFLYLSSTDNQEFELGSAQINGIEMKLPPETPRKSVKGFLPVVIKLPQNLEYGSFHCFEARITMGGKISTVIRARDDFFALGMWGYRNYGESEADGARDTCRTFREYLFNTHMGMAGNQSQFLRQPAGLQLLTEMGLRFLCTDPATVDIRHPQLYARLLLDEPDVAEAGVKELPEHLRVGAYAQGLVERQQRWTALDPRTLTLLNVNLTYTPQNLLTYGPLPDILATDPYYQSFLNAVYTSKPGRLAQFCHPYIVFGLAEVARWASQPKPAHIILNAVSERSGEQVFRYGTPEEKRIEFYYSLAAGAKGISYWWFTPYGEYYGCGSGEPPARAMMKELARLNAEARSLLPLLATACAGTEAGEKLDAFAQCRPPWLMARTLFAGTDTALVLLINRNHCSDRLGTLFEPIPRAILNFQLPYWLTKIKVYRFNGGAMDECPFTLTGETLQVELNNIQLTEIIIITAVPQLPEQVRQEWQRLQPQLQALSGKE